MRRNVQIAALSSVLAFGIASLAHAQTWKRGHGNGHDYIEIASQQAGASLRIECGDGPQLWLRYYPPRTWNGAGKVSVRAGSYTSAMEIDGGDGALLSNLPNNGIGMSNALVNALKERRSLVIEGAATARVALGQRSFTLPDGRNMIAQLEKRCAR